MNIKNKVYSSIRIKLLQQPKTDSDLYRIASGYDGIQEWYKVYFEDKTTSPKIALYRPKEKMVVVSGLLGTGWLEVRTDLKSSIVDWMIYEESFQEKQYSSSQAHPTPWRLTATSLWTSANLLYNLSEQARKEDIKLFEQQVLGNKSMNLTSEEIQNNLIMNTKSVALMLIGMALENAITGVLVKTNPGDALETKDGVTKLSDKLTKNHNLVDPAIKAGLKLQPKEIKSKYRTV